MSLVRLIPAWFHAIADYAVAITLIAVAFLVGGPGKAVAAGVVIGAVVLAVSMLTRYPLGVVKVLPFKVHSAGDYLAAALLVASPFALGFTSSARTLTVVYVAAGVAVLGVSLLTNYQYGPRSQAAVADPGGQVPIWQPAAAVAAPTAVFEPAPIAAAAPALTLHEALIEQAAARWPSYRAAS